MSVCHGKFLNVGELKIHVRNSTTVGKIFNGHFEPRNSRCQIKPESRVSSGLKNIENQGLHRDLDKSGNLMSSVLAQQLHPVLLGRLQTTSECLFP